MAAQDEARIYERLGSMNAHLEAISHHLATLNGRVGKTEEGVREHLKKHEVGEAFARGRSEVFVSRRQIASILGLGTVLVAIINAAVPFIEARL